MRCSFCQGFLPFSFITYDGITVYRCGNEDSFNEKGRFFILVATGPIEVTPKRQGGGWTYDVLDTERRRLQQETDKLNEEIETRRRMFMQSQARLNANYKREDEDAPVST